MSLEVTLIPLALVVINVMDQEYYNSWVKNKRIKKKTTYDSLEDFVCDLNKIEYEYDIKHDVVKVYSCQKCKPFYFSRINGNWVLSFSEYDNREDIAVFLEKISKISCGKVTSDVPTFTERNRGKVVVKRNSMASNMPTLSNRSVNLYPTIYTDRDLLTEVLKKMEISYTIKGNDIEYEKDGVKCTFLKDDDGKYILRMVGDLSDEDIYRSLQELDVVYKRNVQKQAYDNVLARISSHNMTLAKQTVMEDETIVLTLNVE